MLEITLYGTRFCPYCIAARRLLKSKKANFKDISVDGDRHLRTEIMQRSGQRTVPQIWIGDTHVGGFDELQRLNSQGKLDKLLAGA